MAVEDLIWLTVTPYRNGYRHCVGMAVVAVDPDDPANGVIVDLDRARRDPDGLVRFETDVVLLRAPEPAGLLHVVANRGLVTSLPLSAGVADGAGPTGEIDPGDGFVLTRGLSVLWVGWQWDVERRPGTVGLAAPEALGPDGRPIAGQARLGFQPLADARHRRLADLAPPWMGRFATLAAADLHEADAILTERDWFNAEPTTIDRHRWCFAHDACGSPLADDEHVWLAGGSRARVHYELTYTTRRCPVVGAGLVTVRDVVARLRTEYAHSLAYGVSQSGRWLRQFVFDTANRDEHGGRIFDGVLCHMAGGRRGEFNHRYAQPSTMNTLGFTHLPPFSPEDGLFESARSAGTAPLTLFTNTATEYWRGDASLVHPVPDGPDWRAYLYAGAHHSGRLPGLVDLVPVQLAANLIDIVWLGRAHMAALEGWVTEGIEPPASQIPRPDDGTGVTREAALAALGPRPGLVPPDAEALPGMAPIDLGPGAADGVGHFPPVVTGPSRPCLVSALDADGNERAGIRLPDVVVPLAISFGWNPEVPRPGVPVELWNLLGGRIDFPPAEIARRHHDRATYLIQVRGVAEGLVGHRHLLADDVEAVVGQAAAAWDTAMAVATARDTAVAAGSGPPGGGAAMDGPNQA